jgi:mRNA interferase MazF
MSTKTPRSRTPRVTHFGATKVLAWGHGLGVRIPLALSRKTGLEDGTAVDLLLQGSRIVIEPLSRPPSLDALLTGLPVKLWTKWTPGRGDVVSVETASASRWPALVLSPAAYSARTGLVSVCPIEQETGVRPFGVELPPGYPVQGVVLADRVTSADVRSSGMRLLCAAPEAVVAAVLERLTPLFAAQPEE